MVATGSNSPPLLRFTLEQYLQMGELGVFGDSRVEFIDGEIFQMSPQMNDHSFVVSRCAEMLNNIFPKTEYWVRIQATLKISGSAPEPDVAVSPGAPKRGREYCSTALLTVEVADTTLNHDLKLKADLYAAGGIAEYWVIDIPHEKMIVHRGPVANRMGKFGFRYSQVETLSKTQQVSPLAAPNASIHISDFFE